MTNNEAPAIYYENWLMRREALNTWVEYWTVIRGRWLQFYKKRNNERAELVKTLELNKFVQCGVVKRTNKRFPFSIDNGNGTYYVKCDSELLRYHWIFAILTAATNKHATELPSKVPASMVEKEVFKKTRQKFQKRPPFQKPAPKNKEVEPSKRRQKYMKRAEDKMRKKRVRKQGSTGEMPSHSASASNLKSNLVSTTASTNDLRRTKRVSFEQSSNETRRIRSMDNLDERPSSRAASARPASTLVDSRRKKSSQENNYENIGYEEDSIELIPQVLVSLNKDGIFTQDSDDETTESSSANTNITSVNSSLASVKSIVNSSLSLQEGNLLNISQTDIKEEKTELKRVSSFTVLSEDNSFDQRDAKSGSIIKNDKMTNNHTLLRPVSASGQRPVTPTSLSARAITPIHKRPVTPTNFSRFLVNESHT